MIDFDALASPLRQVPYEWAPTEHALDTERAGALIDTFPAQDFWQIAGHDGEKSYTGPQRADMPASLISTSRPPRRSIAPATARSTDASSRP